jgi:hypothetical protein
MLFDVAGEPAEHGLAVEAITTVTDRLFANIDVVNVDHSSQIHPFTFHW